MTPEQAADWMFERFEAQGFLYQEEAASYLLHLQDETLAYYDQNSTVCVGRAVLKRFNDLTPDDVYERAGKFWRHRLPTDQPARQQ